MTTFLITWNPEKWNWRNLRDQVAKVDAGVRVPDEWSCRSRSVIPGDRLFLLKQGKGERGIMASAWATSIPMEGPHWDPVRAAAGEKRRYVELNYDVLLDPEIDDLLTIEKMETGRQLGKFYWRIQGSGISVNNNVAAELEMFWRRHLRGRVDGATQIAEEYSAREGEAYYKLALHYRREARLRDEKITSVLQSDGRLVCEVPGCGFDFMEKYGSLGEGYAQVHHRRQLALGERETKLDDLVIVCANCHVMIHLEGKNRSLGGLVPRTKS